MFLFHSFFVFQGPCTFVVKSCSMFNKDYEVFRDAVDYNNNRWLFVNRVGKGFFDTNGYIDLENYVRIDPNDKKKGQVLWKLKYNEKPHFDMGQTLDDSESDGESNPFVGNMYNAYLQRLMNRGDHRFYTMKWRTFSEAKLKSVKNPGGAYNVKIKAKGYCTREVTIKYTTDENGQRQRHVIIKDEEVVTKISYKIKTPDGNTIDQFHIYPAGRTDLEWDCGAFNATLTGGWFSNNPHEIVTKPGIDPGFALLFAHVCVTEFAPDEIKKDLKPNWNMCPGYTNPHMG